MIERSSCAGLVAALLAIGSAAGAVQPVGTEFQVNSSTVEDEAVPVVAAATGGQFMAVWNRVGDGSGAGVFGRVFDNQGNAIGAEFQVNTYTGGSQLFPAVTGDASGHFVTVWSSGHDGSDYGVFGQRFDSNGAKVGAEFQVNTHTFYSQGYEGLSVSAGASGDFVVAWSSYYQDGYGWGVFGQRFNSDGTPTGTEFQVNTYTYNNQGAGNLYGGVVAAKSAGGAFVVAWASYYQDGYGYGVFGRSFLNDGTPTSAADFQINTTTSSSEGVYGGLAAAGGGTGGFVVSWTSYGQDGDYLGVFGQRLSGGTLVGSEFQVNTYTVNAQGFAGPWAAADAGDDFVIVWSSNRQDGSGSAVMGQRYLSDGTSVGVEFQANTYTIGQQWFPSVAADWGGCSVIVWRTGQRSTDVPCTMDTDCPKYPLEECLGSPGICKAIGQQDGSEGTIFGQRYCETPHPDHYQCYKVKDHRLPVFKKRSVSLVDQFVSYEATVLKPRLLCTPVDKNGEGINDPALHRCCYALKAPSLKPRPQVEVASQFQASRLDVVKGKYLCAPCTKEVLSP